MDNKKELLKYIDMCQASWTNETSMDYILMNGGQGDTFEFRETDVQGFWLENKNNIYIVFRSTENKFSEWLENFNFFPSNDGFHRGVSNKINELVYGYFRKLLCFKYKNIYFIGHSLGGCIARQLGIEFSTNKNNYYVVTFGSYCTTQKKWLRFDDSNTKNYMITSDASNLFTKFLRIFGYKDKYIYLKKKGFWSMENHDIKVYREVIENA